MSKCNLCEKKPGFFDQDLATYEGQVLCAFCRNKLIQENIANEKEQEQIFQETMSSILIVTTGVVPNKKLFMFLT